MSAVTEEMVRAASDAFSKFCREMRPTYHLDPSSGSYFDGAFRAALESAIPSGHVVVPVAGRVLTCVYCGHEYPQDTPAHGDKVLTDHIAGCAKHPMRAVIEDRDRLRADAARYKWLRNTLKTKAQAMLWNYRGKKLDAVIDAMLGGTQP